MSPRAGETPSAGVGRGVEENLCELVECSLSLPLLMAKAVLLACLLALVAFAAALNNGLARTPPMGWNTWNFFGCDDQCVNGDYECVSEDLVKATADAMVSSGMAAVGFEYINLDDCYLLKERDSNGNLQPDPKRFPSGLAALADYVHSKGLKFGLYGDSGNYTCMGFAGSLGHEQQDANQLAAWGVDYWKLDGCWLSSDNTVMEPVYTKWSQALNSTGRPIVFSCSWPAYNDSCDFAYVSTICNLWREFDDITPNLDHIIYISNWQNSSGIRQFAGPGHWNDPDMLEIGNPGMSDGDARIQLSVWAILAAPLIAGNDLRNMSENTRAILTNAEVIAVDQDAGGVQGWLVSLVNTTVGLTQIWMRPLSDGTTAVAMVNAGSVAQYMSVPFSAIGLSGNRATTLDLWSGEVGNWNTGVLYANVQPRDVVMWKVTPSN